MTPISETVLGVNLAALLAVVALFLILGWFVLMTRGKEPLKIRLKGFGVEIDISPTQQKENKHDENPSD